MLGLAACAQVLGLDDLHDRAALSTSPDASEASAPAVDSGADVLAAECHTNAECLEKKVSEGSTDGAVCVSGQCVDLRLYAGATPVCYQNAFPSNDALKDPETVLLAAFVALTDITFESEPAMLAYRLALEELQPDKAGAGWPKLAMVVCSSDEKDGIVDKGIEHVIDDLHVPIIIAGFDPAKLSTVAVDKTVDAGIFIVNPSVASESLKYLNTNNLVLNLLGAPADVALAYRPLLQSIEARVRQTRDAGADDAGKDAPVKVALIDTKDTLIEAEMATVILDGPIKPDDPSHRDPSKAAVVNDAGLLANRGQDDFCAADAGFCWLPIGDLENKNPPPDYDDIKKKLLAFRPDVVIALTRDEILPIVVCYERALLGFDEKCSSKIQDNDWPLELNGSGDSYAQLPYWLLGPRNATEILPFLPKGSDDTSHDAFKRVQRRFFGVQFAGAMEETVRMAWLERMEVRWGKETKAQYQSQENRYDAIYWAAYGLVAARPRPDKGESYGTALSAGVRRMFGGGPPVTPPPAPNKLVQLSGGNVEFEGALGPADIDERFNTWKSVGGVYCYRDDIAQLGKPVVPTISYDSRRYVDGGLTPYNDRQCFVGQP